MMDSLLGSDGRFCYVEALSRWLESMEFDPTKRYVGPIFPIIRVFGETIEEDEARMWG